MQTEVKAKLEGLKQRGTITEFQELSKSYLLQYQNSNAKALINKEMIAQEVRRLERWEAEMDKEFAPHGREGDYF